MLSEKGEDEAARNVLKQGMTVATSSGDAHAASEMAQLLETMV